MNEVYNFLKQCETYYLSTMDGDQPRVRPFGTITIFEDKLYILTGKAKDVSKQMCANPKIEICGMTNDKWIRIEATIVNDDRMEAKQHMLDTYPTLKSIYTVDDDNTQVLYLKNVTANICSFTEAPAVIKF